MIEATSRARGMVPVGKPLTMELIPGSAWHANLRGLLSDAEWYHLRNAVFSDAGSVCEICGGTGSRVALECHEVFLWDESTCSGILRRLVALCPPCHMVKHYGRLMKIGFAADAERHLAKVNGWTAEEVESHVRSELGIWMARSKREWDMDFSLLGVDLLTDNRIARAQRRKLQKEAERELERQRLIVSPKPLPTGQG
jgi:hypothetical protein